MTSRKLLFSSFPEISTKNLVLRKLDHSDSKNLSELFNRIETQKYQTKNFYSSASLYDYIENQKMTFNKHEIIKWVIERKIDGEFIGLRILYCDDDSGWVEIQGDTKKEYWMKGYTKEAYLGIIGKLRDLKFKGISSIIQIDNTNAKFLLRSLNFKVYKDYVSNGINFQEYRLNLDSNFFDKIMGVFR